MTGSTISSISAAIIAPPANIEPPGPRPSRPGPRSPAWPLGHKPSCDRPSCALSRPEPIKLTVPFGDMVAVSSIDLERHGDPGSQKGRPPTPAIPARQPPDPCNKLQFRSSGELGMGKGEPLRDNAIELGRMAFERGNTANVILIIEERQALGLKCLLWDLPASRRADLELGP